MWVICTTDEPMIIFPFSFYKESPTRHQGFLQVEETTYKMGVGKKTTAIDSGKEWKEMIDLPKSLAVCLTLKEGLFISLLHRPHIGS